MSEKSRYQGQLSVETGPSSALQAVAVSPDGVSSASNHRKTPNVDEKPESLRPAISKSKLVIALQSFVQLEPEVLMYALAQKFNTLTGARITSEKEISNFLFDIRNKINQDYSFLEAIRQRVGESNLLDKVRIFLKDTFDISDAQINQLQSGSMQSLPDRIRNFKYLVSEIELIKRFSTTPIADVKKGILSVPRVFLEGSEIVLTSRDGVKERFIVIKNLGNSKELLRLRSKITGQEFSMPKKVVENQNPRTKLGLMRDTALLALAGAEQAFFYTGAFLSTFGAVQPRFMDIGNGKKEWVTVLMPWHNIKTESTDPGEDDTSMTAYVKELKNGGKKVLLPNDFGGNAPTVEFDAFGLPIRMLDHKRINVAKGHRLPIIINRLSGKRRSDKDKFRETFN